MEKQADTEISTQESNVDDILKRTLQDTNVKEIQNIEEVDNELKKTIKEKSIDETQCKEQAIDGSGDQWRAPARPAGCDAASAPNVDGPAEDLAPAAACGASEVAGGGAAQPPQRPPVSVVRALVTLGVHGLLALLFADILVGRPLQNTFGMAARFWAVGSIVGLVVLLTAATLAYKWRPWGVAPPAEVVEQQEEPQEQQQQLLPTDRQLPPEARQLSHTSGLLRTRSAPELKILFRREAEPPASSSDGSGITA